LVERNRTAKLGSLNTIIGSTTAGWGGGMWWTRWRNVWTQSPYHFAGNNPVNNYEVNGADYYMSPFDSKKWSDDDDGIGDMGDALGSDVLNIIGSIPGIFTKSIPQTYKKI
jgi:hypothetical protein